MTKAEQIVAAVWNCASYDTDGDPWLDRPKAVAKVKALLDTPSAPVADDWKCENCGTTLCYYENCHECGATCKECAERPVAEAAPKFAYCHKCHTEIPLLLPATKPAPAHINMSTAKETARAVAGLIEHRNPLVMEWTCIKQEEWVAKHIARAILEARIEEAKGWESLINSLIKWLPTPIYAGALHTKQERLAALRSELKELG